MSAENGTAPMYVTISTPKDWSVGLLHRPQDGNWWVDVKRTGLRFEDAADLRDAWNARGQEKRP